MREFRVTLPQVALIAGTRGLTGLGAGLLIAGFMKADRRRTVGLALLVAGALSTIPLAWTLIRASGDAEPRRIGREDEPTSGATEPVSSTFEPAGAQAEPVGAQATATP